MNPPKLSVIMPCVNGGMDVIYTMQSLLLELKSIQSRLQAEVELVLINNWCPEVARQHMKTAPCGRKMTRADVNEFMYGIKDKWGKKMASYAQIHKEVKYYTYQDKLSHWQAKNTGIRATSGDDTDFLFFCDAHCIITPGALRNMYTHYWLYFRTLKGTLHLPLNYMLDKPGRKLIYKLGGHCDPEKGMYHYSFTPYRKSENDLPFTVGAMSTCGMMMTRGIYNTLGGWPTELGVYGGGENFINFTLAVLGYNKVIYNGEALYHEGKEKRGYNFYGDDYLRNRLIATYMFGGLDLIKKYAPHCKGNQKAIEKMCEEIHMKCSEQRKQIESLQVIDIEEWYHNFKSQEMLNGEPI